MSYFLFNDINSDELGLMVTKTPIRPTWEQETTEFTLSGRSSKYVQMSKTYGFQTMTIETFLDYKDRKNLQKVYNSIKGEGILWLSSSPDEYLEVIAHTPDISPVACFSATCTLKFTVRPFARAVSSTTVEITSENSYFKVNNGGSVYSEPLISFRPQTARTVINVNGADFVVNTPPACSFESTIFIDCEEQICYFRRPEGEAYTCMQSTENDLPLLHTGENWVMYTGATQDFKINVKERFL